MTETRPHSLPPKPPPRSDGAVKAVDTMRDLHQSTLQDLALSLKVRNRVGRDLNRLFELDPTLPFLRPLGLIIEPRLDRLHPTNPGLSRKRLNNIKSSCRYAIRYHHKVRPGATRGGGLRGEWASVYELLAK